MKKLRAIALAAAFPCLWAASASATIVVTNTNDANVLANAIVGTGITVSNATYSGATSTASGTFTAGNSSSLGFDTGIILTTGTTACVPGPNNSSGCTGGGTTTSLAFDFEIINGDDSVFFNYVWGSEEYNEYVDSSFNDTFDLLLDGVNIAKLPNGQDVEIDTVNNGDNSAFYRDNTVLGLDLQYDGLTTVLTASATGLSAGIHTFQFLIQDAGDSSLDSGVFVSGGTFSTDPTPVPEPSIVALLGLGLLGIGARKKAIR